MMRDLYSSLTVREQRAIRWSAAATAAALWLSTAWADPWFLLSVPLIAGGYFAWLKQSRRRGPQEPDDGDWDF
jgi:glycine/D-amino acid oxidase-like deaminating enzyme